jgi:hypothetical protein
LDPEVVERMEAELDSFIERRARQAKDAESTAELWLKTEDEHREKKRQRNGWGWIRHYEGLARAHRTLALENDSKADHVRGLLGLPIEEKEGEMSKKPKTKLDHEHTINARVPGGRLTDYRPEEITRPLGPATTKRRKKPKSIGHPVPKKKGV